MQQLQNNNNNFEKGTIEDFVSNAYFTMHNQKMTGLEVEILPEKQFYSKNDKRVGTKLESGVMGLYYPEKRYGSGRNKPLVSVVATPQHQLFNLLVLGHEIGHHETLKNGDFKIAQASNEDLFRYEVLNEITAYSYQNAWAHMLAEVYFPEMKNEILALNEMIIGNVADPTKPHFLAGKAVLDYEKQNPGMLFEWISGNKLNYKLNKDYGKNKDLPTIKYSNAA